MNIEHNTNWIEEHKTCEWYLALLLMCMRTRMCVRVYIGHLCGCVCVYMNFESNTMMEYGTPRQN